MLLNKLAFLPLLLIIGSMSAYAQVPESYYNQTKIYDNQQSNPKITVSVDKFSYTIKDTIHVKGFIPNYKEGSKVTLSLIDPLKKTVSQLSVSATRDGFYNFDIDFPRDANSGQYSLVAYYSITKSQALVSFNVIGNETPTSISIPYGASIQFNKPTFNPPIFKVQAGLPITWTNNDNVVHQIASGSVGIGGRVFSDGKFDSGVISPGQTYTFALFDPGNYTYFDKTSPWLVGKLNVVPYSGPTSQKPTQSVIDNNTSSADDYLSVVTQRLDLESSEKTLFNDNMTSLFKIVKDKADNVTLTNDKDAKIGKNSFKITVSLAKTGAYVNRDYTVNKLQDWSNYNYLNFWFKGQNTKKTITVLLRDPAWKSGSGFNIVDNSTDWRKVHIPLYSTYYNMSMSNIRGLEFHFDKGTKGQFKIDSIQLVSEGKKTLFNDYIASTFKSWKQTSSNSITISDSNDAKVGINSLDAKVTTTNGTATIYRDYTVNKLQDWSNYNYLNFWFKGQNTKKTITIDLRDSLWKTRNDYYNLIDDSSDWKKVQIPLYSTYKNIDLTKIRGLEFSFGEGMNAEFKLDDVALSIIPVEPTLHLDKDTYISGETIDVEGNVKVLELGAAVSIRVIDPDNNIATVNQVIPKSYNAFVFPLHISGNQFDVGGTYKISAQYGLQEHKTDTSFTLLTPKLVGIYKGFSIYNVNKTFYALLQTQGDFDITRIIANQYSTILTNDTKDKIKQNIDEIVPSVKPSPIVKPPTKPIPTFPVSNDVLLAIWENRTDLQLAYPEVKQGNLTGLKIWAETIGWNQEPRLSELIPQGEVPAYLIQNKTTNETQTSTESHNELIPYFQMLIIIVVIAIGGTIGYKFYLTRKKTKTAT